MFHRNIGESIPHYYTLHIKLKLLTNNQLELSLLSWDSSKKERNSNRKHVSVSKRTLPSVGQSPEVRRAWLLGAWEVKPEAQTQQEFCTESINKDTPIHGQKASLGPETSCTCFVQAKTDVLSLLDNQ